MNLKLHLITVYFKGGAVIYTQPGNLQHLKNVNTKPLNKSYEMASQLKIEIDEAQML